MRYEYSYSSTKNHRKLSLLRRKINVTGAVDSIRDNFGVCEWKSALSSRKNIFSGPDCSHGSRSSGEKLSRGEAASCGSDVKVSSIICANWHPSTVQIKRKYVCCEKLLSVCRSERTDILCVPRTAPPADPPSTQEKSCFHRKTKGLVLELIWILVRRTFVFA